MICVDTYTVDENGTEKREGTRGQSPNFWTYEEPRNQFQGINSDSLCSLAGRYNNPIPTRFLAPLECLKGVWHEIFDFKFFL